MAKARDEYSLNGDLLRLIICGSVDDGKSTLLGRLLYDCQMVAQDQLSDLDAVSRRFGTTGDSPDLALLIDGLHSEMEQGITIDVAYRFFSTARRKFIIADVPGHEQYTRNMVTGASSAELAVLLIDARKGLSRQTHRHANIAKLMGITNFVIAINKMDAVGYDRKVYDKICTEFQHLARQIGLSNYYPIPVSALNGDNISSSSPNLDWFDGKTLLEHLETVAVKRDSEDNSIGFRFPIQWVNRPNDQFRGYAGLVSAGEIHPGDEIIALPSRMTSHVKEIITFDGSLNRAVKGDAVTLTLGDEMNLPRGSVLVKPEMMRIETGSNFRADLVWLSERHSSMMGQYLMRIGYQWVDCTIERIEYLLDIQTLTNQKASEIAFNDIARVVITTTKPIIFDAYDVDREMGGFILVDRANNETLACGMVLESVKHQEHEWQAFDDIEDLPLDYQSPQVILVNGKSYSRALTYAKALEKSLIANGNLSYVLEAEALESIIGHDVGLRREGKKEWLRRTLDLAKLMANAGLIAIVAKDANLPVDEHFIRQMTESGALITIASPQ